MGLLIDKYNEYLEKLRGVNLRDENDFSGMDSDFNTSGAGIKTSLRERESPLMKNPIFPTNIIPPGEGKVNRGSNSIQVIPKSAMGKQNVELQKIIKYLNKMLNLQILLLWVVLGHNMQLMVIF